MLPTWKLESGDVCKTAAFFKLLAAHQLESFSELCLLSLLRQLSRY